MHSSSSICLASNFVFAFVFSLFLLVIPFFLRGIVFALNMHHLWIPPTPTNQLLVKGVNETLVAQRVVPALITLSSDPEM